MGMKILTGIFFSRLRKREGLEVMEVIFFIFSAVGAGNVNMFKNKIDIYLRRISQRVSLSTCHLELIL